MALEEKSHAVPFTLRTVYIQNSKLRMADNFDPAIPGQTLTGKFRTATGGEIKCKEFLPESGDGPKFRICTFVVRFEFRYYRAPEEGTTPQETEEDAHMAAEITADIAADYLIGTPEMPSQAELESWGKGNVLLHAWPYWREYCHASMSRMNLPVTMMPLLQLKPHKPEKVVEEELSAPPKLP